MNSVRSIQFLNGFCLLRDVNFKITRKVNTADRYTLSQNGLPVQTQISCLNLLLIELQQIISYFSLLI
ncbi:MAG TPA: hypothetical protein DCM07_05595 [Planctomycetaceae bacterium]|nr:hypothetical protein [Planctomycetaceae bacterium]